MEKDIKILTLNHKDPVSWRYFPFVLERAKRFMVNKGLETYINSFCSALQSAFILDTPCSRVIVALKGEEIIGHLIAGIEIYWGEKQLLIYQYNLDEAIPPEILKGTLAEVCTWAKCSGVAEIRALVLEEPMTRVFSRYGFEKYGYTMRKKL